MTQSLIQECVLKGGEIESWRPERSRVAFVEGFVACGAWPQEPSGIRQPNNRRRNFVAHSDGGALARCAGEVRQVDDGLSALSTMERGWRLGSGRYDPGPGDGRQFAPQCGFDDGSRSCLSRRRKRGT